MRSGPAIIPKSSPAPLRPGAAAARHRRGNTRHRYGSAPWPRRSRWRRAGHAASSRLGTPQATGYRPAFAGVTTRRAGWASRLSARAVLPNAEAARLRISGRGTVLSTEGRWAARSGVRGSAVGLIGSRLLGHRLSARTAARSLACHALRSSQLPSVMNIASRQVVVRRCSTISASRRWFVSSWPLARSWIPVSRKQHLGGRVRHRDA